MTSLDAFVRRARHHGVTQPLTGDDPENPSPARQSWDEQRAPDQAAALAAHCRREAEGRTDLTERAA